MHLQRLSAASAISALALLPLAAPAAAQTCESQIVASDRNANDFFGASLATNGDEIAVGANGAGDGSGDRVGAVYIFGRDTATSPWTERTKLQPAVLLDDDNYGASLAMEGTTLIVGAPETAGVFAARPGAVFVYERSPGGTWTETDVLEPVGGGATDRFGASVALDGDTLLVGSPGHDAPGAPGGSVYVYERGPGGTWSLAQRLDIPVTNSGSGFGTTVALEGDLACVGGPNLTVTGLAAGGVFAYTRDLAGNWSLLDSVQAPGIGIADFYGQALALENGRLAVGAPRFDATLNDDGAVWVFEFDASASAFLPPVQLAPTQTSTSNQFGKSLAMDGDRLLVGAPASDSVYVFDRVGGTWTSPRWITPTLIGSGNSIGESVALDGDRGLIGDLTDSSFIFRDGTAYITDVSLPDADMNGVSDVCEGWFTVSCTQPVPNSSGASATIDAVGSPFAADQSLGLVVRDLPRFQFALLVASQTPGMVVTPGNSQGTLCLGGTIGRFNAEITPSNANGSLTIDVPLGNMPPPLPQAVAAGDTWYFQIWHRDINPAQTANFSEAISITYQ